MNSLFFLALRGRALLASLGMFAVDPRWQGVGIGKCCLQRAEAPLPFEEFWLFRFCRRGIE